MSSLWGTFAISRQAMTAQSHSMELISQNVANVNTTGYKGVESRFKTLLEEKQVSSNTNFFSARPADRQFVTTQGQPQNTGQAHDLAINGDGFFITNPQRDGTGQPQYTRAGNFTPDLADDGNVYLRGNNDNYLLGRALPLDGTGLSAPPDLNNLTPIDLTAVESVPGQATTSISIRDNVPAEGDQESYKGGATVYDSEGNAHELQLDWAEDPEITNGWTVTARSAGGVVTAPDGGTTFDVVFSTDGEVQRVGGAAATNIDLTADFATGDAQTVTVDLADTTQLGGEYVRYEVDQNGYPPGDLDRSFFTDQGVLRGAYTNKQEFDLYEVPLADFTNPNRLEQISGTAWHQSTDSGAPVVFRSGDPGRASEFMVETLETSNVDLGDQFTRMITTQRAYSSAAKAFTTADEMTQTVRDMKN